MSDDTEPTLPASALRALQTAVETLVETALPSGVSVFSRLRGHIENDVQAALASIGLSVSVIPPQIASVNPSAARQKILDVRVEIILAENPTTNGTGVDIYQLLEAVIRTCHHARVADTVLTVGEGGDISDPDGSGTTYQLYLNAKITI